jgi:hypothetical protein
MRHLAATIALDEGIALAVVQEMLGHSDIRVTRAYTQSRHSSPKPPQPGWGGPCSENCYENCFQLGDSA